MTAEDYKAKAGDEFYSILHYWIHNIPDWKHGGFLGRIDSFDRPHADAIKGLVLNSRILWTFSAASWFANNDRFLAVARRAYEYLVAHFLDKEHGGAYWSLEPGGQPREDRKQIDGQASLLFGLSEYYRASGDLVPLRQAIALYRLIEQHGFDPVNGGYFQGFSRDWQPLDERRISEAAANDQKAMATQLHVLEAYGNLYRSWPDKQLRQRITGLLAAFEDQIVDPASGHLRLFFTAEWEPRSVILSYGHEIETAWLLSEAARIGGDVEWIKKADVLAIRLAGAAAEGLDTDGGLWNGKEVDAIVGEKHWWPQAEAMVGFLHVWELTGEEIWWERSVNCWNFVERYIKAAGEREWHRGVLADHSPMPGQDKAGFWKCPYHNSRACMEVVRRLTDRLHGTENKLSPGAE
jgi:mannobiose 2-epimerase